MLVPVYVLLLLISAIDIHSHRIPNQLLATLFTYAVGYLLLQHQFLEGLLRALVAVISTAILNFLLHSSVGMGDIKLIVILSLFMTSTDVVSTFLISMVFLSGVLAIISILIGKSLREHIAFGPVIALAFISGTLFSGLKK